MAKFPKTIYVTREYPTNDDSYLQADAEMPEPDETTPCAIYQLIEISEVVVTRTLQKKNGRKR